MLLPNPDRLFLPLLAAFLLAAPAGAAAQQPRGTASVIAIPPLATAKVVDTEAGTTWEIANRIAELVSADLKSATGFIIADVKDVRTPSFPEVTAPAFAQWRATNAKYLMSGFVNARSDGRLTIGCYVYDVQSGREVTRQGFAVAPTDWRRAAHRCADAAYTKATGNPATFDSRIVYVAQSGRPEAPTKRIAVMDFDGANHGFLTDEQTTVLTPHWSPKADRIAYTSYRDGRLHVRLLDAATGADRPLLPPGSSSFAPAFSPDGERIALSMSINGNVDIYAVPADGNFPQRLTASPAIDTSPSYSPDGTRIAFVSDRSGSPQLYVMDADGTNQARVSFGRGDYGSPAWSPDGKRLAFTVTDGVAKRIGVMNANGSEELAVTAGAEDEQPSWSPDGTRILFQRLDRSAGRTQLASVAASGGEARPVPTPQGASDPAWAERQQ